MQPGEIIGDRFTIERIAGQGGVGQIYRALDRQSGRHVALKLLSEAGQSTLERFLQEAAVLADIHHPGIVRYVAHGHDSRGAVYLAMEWLEGQDLHHYLDLTGPDASQNIDPATELSSVRDVLTIASGPPATMPEASEPSYPDTPGSLSAGSLSAEPNAPVENINDTVPMLTLPTGRMLSIDETITLGHRLSSAVAELHRRGIIHRDIKPSNIFLPERELAQAKLIDLGAVWRPSLNRTLADTTKLVGTPAYMAPEQAMARGELTCATDVWALGCVLYQCLAGVRPFDGKRVPAVFANILLADPRPLAEFRDDVPPLIADLISRALSKNPASRPASAIELAAELDIFRRQNRYERAHTQPTKPITLTAAGTRVRCVLLASALSRASTSSRADSHADTSSRTQPSPSPAHDEACLAAIVAPVGARLRPLADGSLLITIDGNHPPTDEAAHAARAALALQREIPDLALALATGRAEGVIGGAVRHAARALSKEKGTGLRIWVDSTTASLLDARFRITREGTSHYLEDERAGEADRLVLGKPVPWIGRERELGQLLDEFERCVTEHKARAVLVTAQPGMGKSRLRREMSRAVAERHPDTSIFTGTGDVGRAGSPYALLGSAVCDAAGVVPCDSQGAAMDKVHRRITTLLPPRDADRVIGFLGEMLGLVTAGDDSLMARPDPTAGKQLIEQALQDWLRAECARGPVILILDDMHWGDAPSLAQIDSALAALKNEPLLVVGLARPEIEAAMPGLWARHSFTRIPLSALSKEASAAFIRAVLGDEVPQSAIERVVRHAEGNAFYLEEMIRALAQNPASAVPETVVGMVQARLAALAPEAVRMLRAASVFGEVFWASGIAALLGEDDDAFHLDEWLHAITANELVDRRLISHYAGEDEYEFRHALIREAAYSMLTEADLRLGHRLAATWLESHGERDNWVLAEHFSRSDDPKRALPYLIAAAEQALQAGDGASVHGLAERAIAAGAHGADLGKLKALQAMASFWQGEHHASHSFGLAAAELLPRGSALWFMAMGSAIAAASRVDDRGRTANLVTEVMDAHCEPGAEAQQITCLCRTAGQQVLRGEIAATDAMLKRIEVLAASTPRLDDLTYAQLHDVRALRAGCRGDVLTSLYHFQVAGDVFERAGDLRNATLQRINVTFTLVEMGDVARARTLCEESLAVCHKHGIHQLINFAKMHLGRIYLRLSGGHRTQSLARARPLLEEVIEAYQRGGNVRAEGFARSQLAALEYEEGNYEACRQHAARSAAIVSGTPGFQSWSRAILARALLALGRVSEACDEAELAIDTYRRFGGLLHGTYFPPLVFAECLRTRGDDDEANEVIFEAAERIRRYTGRFGDREGKARYVHIPEHRAILEWDRAVATRRSG